MRERLNAAAAALRRVAASPDIRRAEAAWLLGWAGEWAWLVALSVFAYDAGGVALVGIVGLARTLPAALLAPALASLADRWPRQRVLLAVHGGRAVLIGAAALVALAGWPPILVIVLASLDGLLAVLHRPSHMALMPALARSPDELVAANVASSTFAAIGVIVGPIVGGLLLAGGSSWPGFVAPAIVFAAAALIVLGIRPEGGMAPRAAGAARPVDLFVGGLRVAVTHRHAGLLLGLFGLQTLVRGMLSVLLVILAIEVLSIGDEGVGYLNAAIGAGGLLGALFSLALVRRTRLAAPVALGLLLWGLPILVVGLVPVTIVAFAALAILGAGNALLDVSGFTLLQRVVPNAARGRFFGLFEAIVMLTVGVGAAIAPILTALAGTRGALIVTGMILPLAVLVGWRWLRDADDGAVVPARELALLRGVPVFAPLPMTVLEEVAGELEPQRCPAGTRIISEGEVGDRFYVLAAGRVEVSSAGHPTHRYAAGASFGEIALLRDVPRTATVTAVDDVSVLVLRREAFLAAVTGDRLSRAAADDVVDEHLHHAD